VELQNAKATVTTGYAGEADLYEIAEDVVHLAESIQKEMVAKRANLGTKVAKDSASRRRSRDDRPAV
jgi:hypothetical protein